MKRIHLMMMVAVVGLLSSLLAMPVHAAVRADGPTLTMNRDQNDILWAELSLETTGAIVRVYVRAPGRHRATVKWQQCGFDGTTAGIYRCGIDVATGSLAALRSGRWTARATVDGTTVGRASFRLRS